MNSYLFPRSDTTSNAPTWTVRPFRERKASNDVIRAPLERRAANAARAREDWPAASGCNRRYWPSMSRRVDDVHRRSFG